MSPTSLRLHRRRRSAASKTAESAAIAKSSASAEPASASAAEHAQEEQGGCRGTETRAVSALTVDDLAVGELAASSAPTEHFSEGDEQEHGNDDERENAAPLRRVFFGGSRCVFAANRARNSGDAFRESVVIVPGLEVRADDVADDLGRKHVREHAFQTVTHFDADFAVCLADKQDDTVVFAFLADFPRLGHTDGKVGHGVAVKGRNGQHGHLSGVGAFQVCKIFFQRGAGSGRNHVRRVVDPSRVRRNVQSQCPGRRCQDDEGRRKDGHDCFTHGVSRL